MDDTSAARRASPAVPRWLQPVAAVFTPPEDATPAGAGFRSVGLRLQVALAASAMAAIWLAPGLTRPERVIVSLMMGLFVAYTVVMAKASAANATIRLVSFPTDLLALFSFAFVIPETLLVVLFAAVLIVTFHTYTCGRLAGFWLAGGVMALTVGALAARPGTRPIDGFTLVLYGVILVVLTLMVDGIAAERRQQARHLARLHQMLRSLAATPTPAATLDSVSEAVRQAVGALFVVVMLREDDHLTVTSSEGIDVDPAASAEQRRAALDRDRSPSGVALATGRPVVVADFAADERFSHWSAEAERWGFASLVVAPFGPADRPVGVVNTYFAEPHGFTDEDVDLIAAYAQQASVVVSLAAAYDHERQLAERLTEADRLKSEFVATVSHELRTPLTAVRGFVATLLARWQDIEESERRVLLERADWNARELGQLIEQVLDFSRLEADPANLISEDLDLGTAVRSLLDRMSPALGGRAVTVDIADGVEVTANESALRRVLTNLLSNAAKFSPDGSPITVTALATGDEVTIAVADLGPGIAVEEQERVFERFYRSAPTAAKRGTGIGLAIARAYVERMGGRIWVESSPGRGATFAFTVPRPRLQSGQTAAPDDAVEPTEPVESVSR